VRFPISCGRYEGARGVSTDGASRLDVLPPADDQLGLIRACQDLVGGFIKVALRLPNGDAVLRQSGRDLAERLLLAAVCTATGPGPDRRSLMGHDVQSAYNEILDVTRLSATGTDPLPNPAAIYASS
jgi:hypothetical protein